MGRPDYLGKAAVSSHGREPSAVADLVDQAFLRLTESLDVPDLSHIIRGDGP